MTLDELEAFYTTEYPKLVKILVLLDARVQEAEDAAQKAMTDFAERSRAGKAPDHPAAYVQRAAINFFIKERQRGRERLPRELQGGHLVIEAHLDDRLTAWEDEQYIKHLLECLTPTQRSVIELVMDGWSTREIAGKLGKSAENVRQHLKNGRDTLKQQPEITSHVPRKRLDQSPAEQGVRSTQQRRSPGRRRSS